jgi:tol-pal system protein YbgF
MQRYGYLAFATSLFLILGASLPNSNDKELIIRLQGEILVLQRQIRDLQESFDRWSVKSETSLNNLSSASDTSARTLSSIEDKLQRNQGTQGNAISGINSHLAKIAEQVSLNTQQTSQINQQINAIKQSLQDYQQKLREREASDLKLDANDPEMAFSQAYLKYKNREYDAAINLFKGYLSLFSQNERADDAAFWLAESLAAQGRFAEALNEYNNLLTKYPDGDKAVSARLKRGITLLRLERRQEGVEELKAVIGRYPGSRESEMARSELTRLGEI